MNVSRTITRTPAAPAQRRAWDDQPLHAKVTAMVTAALVAGVGLGIAEAHMGHQAWPLAVGLTVCCGAILWLTRHWVVAPSIV